MELYITFQESNGTVQIQTNLHRQIKNMTVGGSSSFLVANSNWLFCLPIKLRNAFQYTRVKHPLSLSLFLFFHLSNALSLSLCVWIPSMYSVSKMKFDRKPPLAKSPTRLRPRRVLRSNSTSLQTPPGGSLQTRIKISLSYKKNFYLFIFYIFFDPLLQALWRNLRNRTVNGTPRNRNFDPNTDPFRASCVLWRRWYATNLAKKNQTMPIMVGFPIRSVLIQALCSRGVGFTRSILLEGTRGWAGRRVRTQGMRGRACTIWVLLWNLRKGVALRRSLRVWGNRFRRLTRWNLRLQGICFEAWARIVRNPLWLQLLENQWLVLSEKLGELEGFGETEFLFA